MSTWDSTDDVLYRGLVYAGGDPNRTPWDDIQDLAETTGRETFFETQVITPPPVFCEPTWYDSEWPPEESMPEHVFMADEIRVCRVHHEYWPCSAVRAGRPVTFPPAQAQNVFVFRPKEETPDGV